MSFSRLNPIVVTEGEPGQVSFDMQNKDGTDLDSATTALLTVKTRSGTVVNSYDGTNVLSMISGKTFTWDMVATDATIISTSLKFEEHEDHIATLTVTQVTNVLTWVGIIRVVKGTV